MFREIQTPFGFPIYGYGLMIVVGFILCLFVGSREVRRLGIPDRVSDLAMVLLVCGILGGRLFYYIQFYEEFANRSFLAFFQIWEGGLVFYGGALGGLTGGLVFLLWKRLPIPDYMDMIAVVAPIGVFFGRWGCFLNGCCFGRLCEPGAPWGVVFPESAPAAARHADWGLIAPGSASLPVHPVQLYQAAFEGLLFLSMWALSRWGKAPRGGLMPLLFVQYGIGRFFLEGLRGDHVRPPEGFTVSQIVSIVLFSIFVGVVVWLWGRAFWTSGRGAAAVDGLMESEIYGEQRSHEPVRGDRA